MNDDHLWRTLIVGLCGMATRFLVAFILEATEKALKAWKDKRKQKECDK
jgi:hypothetical protein